MGGYLLLRDNKKTGPYSLSDLKLMGVRESDLLWIDTVSTCWKSPAELEELRPYIIAPAKSMQKEPVSVLSHQIQPLHENFNNRSEESEDPTFYPDLAGRASKTSPSPYTENYIREPAADPATNRRKEILRTYQPSQEPPADHTPHSAQGSLKREPQQPPGETSGIIKVIIADDHALFREGVKLSMASRPDIQVIGEAGTGAQLLTLLNTLIPDIILLDIQMPVMDGIEALKAIRKKHGDIKVIMLSMHEDPSMVSTLLQAGANAYLSKTDDAEKIYTAIKGCKEKDYYFDERSNRAMLQQLRGKSKPLQKTASQEFDGAELMWKLTDAQKRYSRRQQWRRLKKPFAIIAAAGAILGGFAGIAYYFSENLEFQSAPVQQVSQSPLLTTPVPEPNPLPPPPATTGESSTTTTAANESATNKTPNQKAGDSKPAKTTTKDTKPKQEQQAVKVTVPNVAENKPEPPKPVTNPAFEAKNLAKANIYNLVTSSVNAYKKGTLGGLSDIQITVSNRSNYTMDRVVVEVNYLLPNDKVFKTEMLEFGGIGPTSTQTKEAPKSPRGVKLQYRIQTISSRELEL